MDPRSRLSRLLDGPAPALPAALDGLAERWAAARPRTRLVVSAAAVLALLAVAGRGATRSPWGPAVAVVVTRADLPAGRTLTPDLLEAARWPKRLVPADALPAPAPALGQRLAVGAPAGTVLTGRHLLRPGVTGDLPAGTVAVPVPLGDSPAVAAGQRVDVLAARADGGGTRLAAGAAVLGVEGEVAWVAVGREEAPAVAGAAAAGAVTLAALPP